MHLCLPFVRSLKYRCLAFVYAAILLTRIDNLSVSRIFDNTVTVGTYCAEETGENNFSLEISTSVEIDYRCLDNITSHDECQTQTYP